jgi:hypothetical protein
MRRVIFDVELSRPTVAQRATVKRDFGSRRFLESEEFEGDFEDAWEEDEDRIFPVPSMAILAAMWVQLERIQVSKLPRWCSLAKSPQQRRVSPRAEGLRRVDC